MRHEAARKEADGAGDPKHGQLRQLAVTTGREDEEDIQPIGDQGAKGPGDGVVDHEVISPQGFIQHLSVHQHPLAGREKGQG